MCENQLKAPLCRLYYAEQRTSFPDMNSTPIWKKVYSNIFIHVCVWSVYNECFARIARVQYLLRGIYSYMHGKYVHADALYGSFTAVLSTLYIKYHVSLEYCSFLIASLLCVCILSSFRCFSHTQIMLPLLLSFILYRFHFSVIFIPFFSVVFFPPLLFSFF